MTCAWLCQRPRWSVFARGAWTQRCGGETRSHDSSWVTNTRATEAVCDPETPRPLCHLVVIHFRQSWGWRECAGTRGALSLLRTVLTFISSVAKDTEPPPNFLPPFSFPSSPPPSLCPKLPAETTWPLGVWGETGFGEGHTTQPGAALHSRSTVATQVGTPHRAWPTGEGQTGNTTSPVTRETGAGAVGTWGHETPRPVLQAEADTELPVGF